LSPPLYRPYVGLAGYLGYLHPSKPLSCLWVVGCISLFDPRWVADRRLSTGGILKRSLFVACITRRDFASRLISVFSVHSWVPGFVIPRFGLLEHKPTGFSVKRFGKSPKGVMPSPSSSAAYALLLATILLSSGHIQDSQDFRCTIHVFRNSLQESAFKYDHRVCTLLHL